MLRAGKRDLTKHCLDAEMDWDSVFDKEDNLAPIFALSEREEESELIRGASWLEKVKNIDHIRAAGAIQL